MVHFPPPPLPPSYVFNPLLKLAIDGALPPLPPIYVFNPLLKLALDGQILIYFDRLSSPMLLNNLALRKALHSIATISPEKQKQLRERV